jgi:hypothetical protein
LLFILPDASVGRRGTTFIWAFAQGAGRAETNGCTARFLNSAEVLLVAVDVELDLIMMIVTFEGVMPIDGWVGNAEVIICRSIDDTDPPALAHGATTKRPSFDPRGEKRA